MADRTGASDTAAMDEHDVRMVVAALAEHWGVLLAFGLSSLALGVCLLVWPGHTLVAIATLLGAYLLVTGVFQIIASFRATDAPGGMRVLTGISGVLAVLLGMLAFRSVLHSLALLALLIGFGWLVRGMSQLMAAIADRTTPVRGWQMFMGALGVVAGICVLVWPFSSLATLAFVGGTWMVVIGVFEILGAFRLRSARVR